MVQNRWNRVEITVAQDDVGVLWDAIASIPSTTRLTVDALLPEAYLVFNGLAALVAARIALGVPPASFGQHTVALCTDSLQGLVTPCNDFAALRDLLEAATWEGITLYSVASASIHVEDRATFQLLDSAVRQQAGNLSMTPQIKFHPAARRVSAPTSAA